MSYNYDKLSGRIIEKCGSQQKFAEKMGLSERSISLKLNNKVPFKQEEISKALDVLGLSSDNIAEYFFKIDVQNHWTNQQG